MRISFVHSLVTSRGVGPGRTLARNFFDLCHGGHKRVPSQLQISLHMHHQAANPQTDGATQQPWSLGTLLDLKFAACCYSTSPEAMQGFMQRPDWVPDLRARCGQYKNFQIWAWCPGPHQSANKGLAHIALGFGRLHRDS